MSDRTSPVSQVGVEILSHVEEATEFSSQVSCHHFLSKHLRLQGVSSMGMKSKEFTRQQWRDKGALTPGPPLSFLDIPDITGSIEPTADWAARSFGSAFDDTLWGWAPVLGHGYALIWGQKDSGQTCCPIHQLVPFCCCHTECRPESWMWIDIVRIVPAIYRKTKTKANLLLPK